MELTPLGGLKLRQPYRVEVKGLERHSLKKTDNEGLFSGSDSYNWGNKLSFLKRLLGDIPQCTLD